ncbi:RdgB/HAM1 family non-canonical purine NTP pyrophosphatase [Gammaproteobacteria bacterium]|nr:RdgB/HAM1 family non-canonical purine NTP pyrophosphatase [Gammaproteobacteria bacterium]
MKVVLASDNPGKLAELTSLLADTGFVCVSQGEFGVSSAEETGSTFVENALLKARHAATSTGLCAIADDSGLAVDHLKGAPGVHSARYSGVDATDEENREFLLTALAGVPADQRTARFHSVVVYLRHAKDPIPIICHGHWSGTIALKPRGSGGFGYDSLFLADGCSQTAAELTADTKNSLSHRAQALVSLVGALKCQEN